MVGSVFLAMCLLEFPLPGDGGHSQPKGNLFTSAYMRNSPTHVEHHMVDSIMTLLLSLQWTRIIILFDQESHATVRELLLHQHLDIQPASFLLQELDQQLMSESGFKAFLNSVHQRFFPELNFILLTDYERSDYLLQMVDDADEKFKRRTDFRHFSFWIQACSSVCQPPSGPHPGIQHLENVILLSPSQKQEITTWHLIPLQNGRIYSPSSLSAANQNKDGIFPNIKYGFNNRTLVMSTLESKKFVQKTSHGDYEGYCIEILKGLASALNFSYQIVQPEDREWGAHVNGSWNGLAGQLERREVDLVIATFSIHEDREKVMDFLYPPIYTRSDDIAYKLTSEEPDRWKIYLENFKPLVLIVLFASFVAITVAIFLMMKFREEGIHNSHFYFGVCHRHLSKMGDVILHTIGMVLNRGVTLDVRFTSTRIVILTWGIFGLVFAAAYSANLVASFAVHKQTLPFTSLAELVRQTEYKWGFVSGNIREHIFRASKDLDMKLAWQAMVQMNKTDPEVLDRHQATHIRKLHMGKYAYFAGRYFIQNLMEDDCSIRTVGKDLMIHHYGVGVPSDYPMSKDLEEKLAMIADSGLLDIWWKRWGKKSHDKCELNKEHVSPINVLEVSSAFYILCAGFGLALIVLLMEKFRKRIWFCQMDE